MKPPKYFQCWVEGLPRPYAKKRFNYTTGHLYPDDKGGHKASWAKSVQLAAKAEIVGNIPVYPKHIPVKLVLTFYLPKPKSSKRKYPCVKPDLSNYSYLVENALSGIAYHDDAQVCESVYRKEYVNDGDSGVLISVREI